MIGKKLSLGDTIGVISPASPSKDSRITECISIFSRLGFNIVEGTHLRDKLGYLAWQDHPPNLSILLSGGKENNRDSLSQRRAKRDRTRCRIGLYRALSCGKPFRDWCGIGEIQCAKQTHC